MAFFQSCFTVFYTVSKKSFVFNVTFFPGPVLTIITANFWLRLIVKMENTRINYLIEQYIAGELTEAESSELLHLLSLPEPGEIANVLVKKMETEAVVPSIISEQRSMEMFQRIIGADKISPTQFISKEEIAAKPKAKVYKLGSSRKWLSVAAALVLVFIGSYFWFAKKTAIEMPAPIAKSPDIAPGKQGSHFNSR
jgi:hypothetical protein